MAAALDAGEGGSDNMWWVLTMPSLKGGSILCASSASQSIFLKYPCFCGVWREGVRERTNGTVRVCVCVCVCLPCVCLRLGLPVCAPLYLPTCVTSLCL